jgi:hypothetical protein
MNELLILVPIEDLAEDFRECLVCAVPFGEPIDGSGGMSEDRVGCLAIRPMSLAMGVLRSGLWIVVLVSGAEKILEIG